MKKQILGILTVAAVSTLPVTAENFYGRDITPIKIAGPTRAMAAAIEENYLFVLGDNALYIYDVKTPLRPKLTAKLNGLVSGRQLTVKNHLAAVTGRANGLWLIDVSKPEKPKIRSHYDTIEFATGVDLAGNIAFVAERIYGVEIIDITDLDHPSYLGRLPTQEAQSVRYRDGRIYVGDWGGSRFVIGDVNDLRHPKTIGTAKLGGYGDGVEVRGNLGFAATGHNASFGPVELRHGSGHGLDIFDIANPEKPVKLARAQFPRFYRRGLDFWTVRVAGDYAFVADTHNGLFVVNIANPGQPGIIARIQLQTKRTSFVGYDKLKTIDLPDAVSGLALGDGVVYLTGANTGLYAAGVPEAKSGDVAETRAVPTPGTASQPGDDSRFHIFSAGAQVRGIALNGDTVYAACANAGLFALKVSEQGFKVLKHWPIPISDDVKFNGELLLSAEGPDGLAIYSVSPDGELVQRGRVKLPNAAFCQRIWAPKGVRLAVATGHTGEVAFIDFIDPDNPKITARHRRSGIVYGDQISHEMLDGKLFHNWHEGGVDWYDLTGSEIKVVQSGVPDFKGAKIDTPEARMARKPNGKAINQRCGAAVFGNKMLVVNNGGLSYVTVDDGLKSPAWNPVMVSGVKLNGLPAVSGSVAAISDRTGGRITTLDLTDPRFPKIIRERCYRLTGCPGAALFWRGRLLIPGGTQGLLLEKKNFSR